MKMVIDFLKILGLGLVWYIGFAIVVNVIISIVLTFV